MIEVVKKIAFGITPIMEMEKQENRSLVEKKSDGPGIGEICDSSEYIIDLEIDWDSDIKELNKAYTRFKWNRPISHFNYDNVLLEQRALCL
jgi:hypothetical protein